jgi:hypothetical protein
VAGQGAASAGAVADQGAAPAGAVPGQDGASGEEVADQGAASAGGGADQGGVVAGTVPGHGGASGEGVVAQGGADGKEGVVGKAPGGGALGRGPVEGDVGERAGSFGPEMPFRREEPFRPGPGGGGADVRCRRGLRTAAVEGVPPVAEARAAARAVAAGGTASRLARAW